MSCGDGDGDEVGQQERAQAYVIIEDDTEQYPAVEGSMEKRGVEERIEQACVEGTARGEGDGRPSDGRPSGRTAGHSNKAVGESNGNDDKLYDDDDSCQNKCRSFCFLSS